MSTEGGGPNIAQLQASGALGGGQPSGPTGAATPGGTDMFQGMLGQGDSLDFTNLGDISNGLKTHSGDMLPIVDKMNAEAVLNKELTNQFGSAANYLGTDEMKQTGNVNLSNFAGELKTPDFTGELRSALPQHDVTGGGQER